MSHVADVLAGRRTWAVLCDDVRRGLAQIPDAVIQTVCTSVPYWSLRAYGTEPQIWGGDPDCDHDLEDSPGAPVITGGLMPKQVTGPGSYTQVPTGWGRDQPQWAETIQGKGRYQLAATCRRCGCWRGELGSEPDPATYVANIVEVFRGVWRVLRDDGTLWLNINVGNYAGSGKGPTGQTSINALGTQEQRQGFADRLTRATGYKPKDLIPTGWLVALALQQDGWYLRSAITLCKVAPMPESVRDRPTNATEMLFLLTKGPRYFYDADAVRVPSAESTMARLGVGVGGIKAASERNDGDLYSRDRSDFGNPTAGANLRNWWEWRPEPQGSIAVPKRVVVSADAADGDMERITSAGCLVHGHLLPASPACDGPPAAPSCHTPDSGSYHALGLFDERPAIVSPSLVELGPDRGDDLAATSHSTPESRMAPDHATSPAYTACEERTVHNDGILDSHESSLRGHDMGENSTPKDGSAAHHVPDTAVGTADISSAPQLPACTCSYTKEVTEIISHFAGFPLHVPTRAISAGTSQAGQCAACGAPWKRQTERGYVVSRSSRGTKIGDGQRDPSARTDVPSASLIRADTTTGWAPSCTCPTDAPPVPQIVCDPFMGSGSTAVAALRLGRRVLGVELNPKYAEMAERRIVGDAPMLNTPAVQAAAYEQLSFDVGA